MARRRDSSDSGGGARSGSTTPTGRCGSSWRRRSARCRSGPRETAVVTLLEKHGDDPIVDGCGAERGARQRGRGAREAAAGWRAAAGARHRPAARRSAKRRSRCWRRSSCAAAQDAACRSCSRAIADASGRPGSATAMMRGAEVALCSARAMPGTPAARRRWRSGGSAAARRRSRRPARRVRAAAPVRAAPMRLRRCRRAARPRSRRRPGLRLNREPAALSALAAAGGESRGTGDRVARARRVAGQAGRGGADRAAHAGGAAAIRRRAGGLSERLQACHQPDGRGQDKIAPSAGRLGAGARAGRGHGARSCSTARRGRSA